MPWTEESPIAAGFGAAAGLIGGFQQGQQQKAEQQRQAELDRQHAIATAVAQKHQQFEESRETSSDAAAADETKYERGRNVASDARAVVAANDAHKSAQLASAKAAFENSPQMQKLTVQRLILDNKYAAGQLTAQQYAIQSAAAESQINQVRAQVAKQYGVSDAELGQESQRAGIAATQAGTARTNQETNDDTLDAPIRRAQGRANLFGTDIDNAGRLNGLATSGASNPALTVDPKDAHAKVVQTETTNALRVYNQRLAKLQAQSDAGNSTLTPNADGTYSDADGKQVLGKPPEDFESYSDALTSLMQDVSKTQRRSARYSSRSMLRPI